VTSTRTNGTNLFAGESEVSQGPKSTKGSNGLADIGTAGLDESSFPLGQRFPAGLDPGEHLVDLLSVGDDELQAPDVESLEDKDEGSGGLEQTASTILSSPLLLFTPPAVASDVRAQLPPGRDHSLPTAFPGDVSTLHPSEPWLPHSSDEIQRRSGSLLRLHVHSAEAETLERTEAFVGRTC